MRATNRVFSFILATALCLSLCTPALATDTRWMNAQNVSPDLRLCFAGVEKKL